MLLIIGCLCALYVLALRGEKRRPQMEAFRTFRYAHRGLHDEHIPENSKAAFRAARDAGFGIEFDLHLLKDGNLGVMHDSDLLRTTGKTGHMEDLQTLELQNYRLGDTEETIPVLSDVLEIYQGAAPLIIELKTHNGNAAALTEATVNQLESYTGAYCIESFDPAVLLWLRRNRPDILRGQLSENYFRLRSPLPVHIKLILSQYLCNFLTKPDFIAHRFEHRRTPAVFLCRRLWNMYSVSWTIRTDAQLRQAEQEGWIPIFERIRPVGNADALSAPKQFPKDS